MIDKIENEPEVFVELISVGFVQSNVTMQYGKHTNLKSKINKYFDEFVDVYRDFRYVWYEDKLYVHSDHKYQIEKDIEKLLNKPIKHIGPKIFPIDYSFKYIDSLSAKKKLERKIRRKIREKERKKQKIKKEFFSVVDNIKANKDGYRHIGCFDLEFWEHNMNYILEFGWRIEDYHGEGETVHLIVQDNLNYKNGFYSKNNRFARTDSKIVPLSVAKQKFKEEFLDKIDVLVGHGLSNDYKVLKSNGMNLKMKFLDTTDIGAVMMNKDDKVSLERLLNHLNIRHDDLHNAANDVEFILKAFFELGDL